MRLEGQHRGRNIKDTSLLYRRLDHRLMAEMDPVEITDSNRCAPCIRGKSGKMAEKAQAGQSAGLNSHRELIARDNSRRYRPWPAEPEPTGPYLSVGDAISPSRHRDRAVRAHARCAARTQP